jgi:hypothetical protein
MSDTSQGPGWWRASDGRWYPPQESNEGKGGAARSVPWWMVGLGVFVAIVLGGVVALVVTRDDGDTASGNTQQLVLEPVSTAGDDPFTESVATQEVAVVTAVSAPSGGDEGFEVAGSQPGLYGGTQDDTACDSAALVEFLEANPDKASAWAGVAGVEPSQIRQYVAGLTPVQLRTDTRVTNHGFANGVATPRQSVLQAGSAVLVDNFGVPRVRCSCGNPLTEPAPLPDQLQSATNSGDVVLVGQPWQRWDPSVVVVVNATVEVNEFVVFDFETEQEYTQPVGSEVDGANADGSKVLVTGDGVTIVGPEDSDLLFGTPEEVVRSQLVDALGTPSEERQADPTDECDADSLRWGEFTAYFDNSVFMHWALSSVVFDGSRQRPLTDDELVGVTTEEDIGIRATQQELLAAHAGLELNQGTPADTMSYTDHFYRTFTFLAPAGPGLYYVQPLWDCEGGG